MAITKITARQRQFLFLHLTVNLGSLGPEATDHRTAIEGVLDKAKDWLRYLPNSWLIYTSRSAIAWHKDLHQLPNMKQYQFLICEVNINNKAGWLYESVWTWINQNRDQQP